MATEPQRWSRAFLLRSHSLAERAQRATLSRERHVMTIVNAFFRGGHWNINEKKEELSLEASTAYRSTTVIQEEDQGERATDTDPVSLPTETSHPFKCETNTPMLKGRVQTEKMAASIKYREHTSLSVCRCRTSGYNGNWFDSSSAL